MGSFWEDLCFPTRLKRSSLSHADFKALAWLVLLTGEDKQVQNFQILAYTSTVTTSQFIYVNLTWPWLTPESPGHHKLWVWLPFSPSPPVLVLVPSSTPRHGLCQVLSIAAPLTKLCPIHPSPRGLYVPRLQIPRDLCLTAIRSCSAQMVQAAAWERRDTGRRSLGFFSGYTHKYERSPCFPEPSKPPKPCKHQLAHKDSPDKAGQHPSRA